MAPGTECNKYLALQVQSGRLTDAEIAFSERHAKSCHTCAEELELFAIMSDECIDVALPFDELSEQRTASDIVELANRAGHGATGKRPGWQLALAGGMAAAALVTGFFVLGLGTDAPGPTIQQPAQLTAVTPAPAPAPAYETTVLLNGNDMESLPVGKQMTTGKNPFVFSTSCGITVSLAPASSFTLAEANNHNVVLDLHNGSLVSSVKKRSNGNAFSVITPHAQMRITGTVFAVTADADTSSLSVLRGSVEIHNAGKQINVVQANQTSRFPEWTVEELAEADQEALWATMQHTDLFDNRHAALLNVESQPAGARVLIDGKDVGVTPLMAKVRSGHRTLALRKEGFQVVTEHMEALENSRQDRAFVLAPVPTELQQTPAASVEGPSELLAAAQKYRIARDWKSAARTYRKIINGYPNSGEAGAALVSLGKLELTMLNQPKQAIAHFNRYLKRGGSLAQEALYAKSAALRATGQQANERAALTEFISRYPNAIEVPAAKARLAQLQ